MAVRAAHFALRDLSFDDCPRHPGMYQLADLGLFVAQVIEVEQQGIRFAAVDADDTKRPYSCAVLPATPHVVLCRSRDLPFPIALVPAVRVGPRTLQANALPSLPVAGAKAK